jgi:hypothetical protein
MRPKQSYIAIPLHCSESMNSSQIEFCLKSHCFGKKGTPTPKYP